MRVREESSFPSDDNFSLCIVVDINRERKREISIFDLFEIEIHNPYDQQQLIPTTIASF